jgi:sulfatase maturation enzyme AslB (radical SAM superfamily)
MNTYLNLDEIKVVHLEHTSKCNLLCPQCARVHEGQLNPELPLSELTLKDYKKIFTPEFAPQLDRVYWCGSYGDSIASGTWMECAFWLRYSGVQSMQLYTNGSARKPDWWKKLAIIFNRPRDQVYFSIDGLADTNHLYRVNSNFDIIMKNAKAFIDAGGNARWDYLVFDHNAHQVEEAKALAKEMGFKSMVIKNTSRFVANKEFKNDTARDTEAVFKQNTGEQLRVISDKGNKNRTKFEYVLQEYGSWSNYVDVTPIECKYQKDKTIYIDFQGKVWPCCWVGAPEHFIGNTNIQKVQLKALENIYSEGFNSMRNSKLEDILKHGWFAESLVNSWGNTQKDTPGKLHTCGRTCGTDYEFTSGLGSSNAERILLNK